MSNAFVFAIAPLFAQFRLTDVNPWWVGGGILAAISLFGLLILFTTRYKRCPSNRVLVIYGATGARQRRQTDPRRGGVRLAADSGLCLPEPGADPDRSAAARCAVDREHPRQRAQRVHRGHRHQARGDAKRGHPPAGPEQSSRFAKQAEEIIFGQLRQVIASMGIEEINRDRDKFLQHVQSIARAGAGEDRPAC